MKRPGFDPSRQAAIQRARLAPRIESGADLTPVLQASLRHVAWLRALAVNGEAADMVARLRQRKSRLRAMTSEEHLRLIALAATTDEISGGGDYDAEEES